MRGGHNPKKEHIMKVHEEDRVICLYFTSTQEYIDQLYDQDLENMAAQIKESPHYSCVKDCAELLKLMNYDEEFVKLYGKIKADVYLPSKKSVATVKQWRDGGTHFSYSRYLEGRPCVWKGKQVESAGNKASRTVPIMVSLSEPHYVKKDELAFKAIACAEMVKAIQAQGKNVELYAVKWAQDPTTRGGYDTLHIIKVKGGADPLVVPRLLSAVSPYFFRCYMCNAQSEKFRYKGFTPKRANIMRGSLGKVKEIAANRKEFFRLLHALGIIGADDAIIIDSGEVDSDYSLGKFRKKHGITIR